MINETSDVKNNPTTIDRRQLLKGMLAGASSAVLLSHVEAVRAEAATTDVLRAGFKPGRPVTAVTLGAGNRGNVYGSYAQA